LERRNHFHLKFVPYSGKKEKELMTGVIQAVLIGMVIVLAGTIPRNLFFAANLHYFSRVPWAAPITGVYLWFFWRYLRGAGPPESTAIERRASLRANRVSGKVWTWALLAGGLGIVALVIALRIANRLVALPQQQLPDLAHIPKFTVLSLLIMAAPVAGIVEESAFRGYMQGPIERRYGLFVAILITGTMFAVAHLDFTLVLWPYYLAVTAIYGTVTRLANSILPAIVLHTAGNIYSNMDLWLHGYAEWQAPAGSSARIWQTGVDASLWFSCIALLVVAAAMLAAYARLARVARVTPA
jgi:membrane protease YdiL (CAAX protease family)